MVTLTPLVRLQRALAEVARQLHDEADALPGTVLAYGRPHAHPRARYLPRWTRSGQAAPGVNRIPPDCPRPIRGRCECPPDGSWRPIGGSQRADQGARSAEFARSSQVPDDDGRYPGLWVDNVYIQGPDGLWRCDRPMRRSIERLRGESMRRFLVLTRILAGEPIAKAWDGLGDPGDPVGATLSITDQVIRMAQEEAHTEWERRPRRWRAVPWTELSESERAAQTNGHGSIAS